MMVRNCERCGTMFQSNTKSICPDCVDVDEENFKKVRDFIKDNPKVSLEVVEEATGVSEERILEYLKEGRLESADLSGPMLACERCGKPISRGSYCVNCQGDLSNTFKANISERKPEVPKTERKTSFVKRYREGK